MFLRVTDGPAFLVTMIRSFFSSKDGIWPFMYVLILSLLGFTDAFYSANRSFLEDDELDAYEKALN